MEILRAKLFSFAVGLWLAGAGCAFAENVPDEEALAVPTSARLELIQQSADRSGWATQSATLHSAARRAYDHDKLAVAAAWLRVYQWSVLLSRSEREFIPVWMEAVKGANAGHGGMPKQYRLGPELLSESFSPECLGWVLQHAEFSDEFFSVVQTVDYLPRVFEILSELHRQSRFTFEAYPSLALAIAVVYDVPPPPDWPHAQVSESQLKRGWADPVEVFEWFTKQDKLGRTQHPLTRLRADELKFVIDVVTPLKELEWAQMSVNLPLPQLERAYTMVSYQRERLNEDKWIWTAKDYALQTILATGGICVDQAYFANAVGKARGVPTLLFSGVGDDGRHAWFGFLGPNQHWHFNAGRYAEQQYVTGFARDPQTWTLISDHELKLLSERGRSSPAFRDSQILTGFASDFMARGEPFLAARAARKAVNHSRRNRQAWEILFAAEVSLGVPPKQREATIREAMLASANYPDLEVYYSKRISESMRARGETSAADFEQRRVTRKFALERTDLGLRNAREAMWRTSGADPEAQLIRNYNATIDRMGPGAGIAFFDEIVLPLIEHLAQQKKFVEAERAVARARRTLRIEVDTQLSHEFTSVEVKLKELAAP